MNKKTWKYMFGFSCRQDRKRRQREIERAKKPKKTLSWLDEIIGAGTPMPRVNGHQYSDNRRVKESKWGTYKRDYHQVRQLQRLKQPAVRREAVMGLGKADFRSFQPVLYGGVGCLETITLLQRGDNQNAGQVTSYLLFNVRMGRIYQTGQEIDGTLSSDNTRTMHIPKIELERAGAGPIRVLDRIVDKEGRVWEPESPQSILSKLTEEHIDVPCRRLNDQGK